MNYNDFTQITQKALKSGADSARKFNHKNIENVHILKGILEVDKNVTPFILRKTGIDMSEFEKKIDSLLEELPVLEANEKTEVSKNVETSLTKAKQIAAALKDEYISVEHILTGILITGDSTSQLMLEKGINQEKLTEAIKELRKSTPKKETLEEKYAILNQFAVNLNEKIISGKLNPVIGRTEEIRRILQIISRRNKNNPIIVGEPGVGKTAVVEGLAQRIVGGDVPENLKNCTLFSLDIASVIAGASKQGEFENRLKGIIREVQESAGEIILFMDEIHLLVGAGKSGAGAMDAANILKPALARGELRAIGATTTSEYQKYIEQDKALVRRFQKVIIEEPSSEDAVSILRGIKEKFQEFHKVNIGDDALVAAVELSKRYQPESFLPDKAIDLIDEAASKLRLEINTLPSEIDELDRKITQLKTEKFLLKDEPNEKTLIEIQNKIADLSDESTKLRAIWESEKTIIRDIISVKNDISELKKQAEAAKQESDFETVAKIQYKSIKDAETKLMKLNDDLAANQSNVVLSKEMVDRDLVAEVLSNTTGIPIAKMNKNETERLIQLETELEKRVLGQKEAVRAVSESIRRSRTGLGDQGKPIGSFIFLGTSGVGKTELAKALAEFLFDDEKNIVRVDMSEYQEKHSISRLIGSPPGYVGSEEGGQLTEQVRQKPYCVVLLDEVEKAHPDIFNTFLQVLDDGHLTDSKGRTVNFKNTVIIMTSNAGSEKISENFEKMNASNVKEMLAKSKEEVSQVLKQTMRPEFLNRIDEIIMFMPISLTNIRKIVEMQLTGLSKKLLKNEIRFHVSSLGITALSRLSYNPQFGARPVKRTIQKFILNELADRILKSEIQKDKIIYIDLKEGKFDFTNITPEELEKIKAEELKTPEVSEKDITKSSKLPENDEITKPKDTAERGFWQRFGDFFRDLFKRKQQTTK